MMRCFVCQGSFRCKAFVMEESLETETDMLTTIKKLVVQADQRGKQRRQKEGKLSEANKTVPESKAEWDKVN